MRSQRFACSQRNGSPAVGVAVGVVGEWSFAEDSQKAVHEIIDSEEPLGWDTQTDNETVFKFSPAWWLIGGKSYIWLSVNYPRIRVDLRKLNVYNSIRLFIWKVFDYK